MWFGLEIDVVGLPPLVTMFKYLYGHQHQHTSAGLFLKSYFTLSIFFFVSTSLIRKLLYFLQRNKIEIFQFSDLKIKISFSFLARRREKTINAMSEQVKFNIYVLVLKTVFSICGFSAKKTFLIDRIMIFKGIVVNMLTSMNNL